MKRTTTLILLIFMLALSLSVWAYEKDRDRQTGSTAMALGCPCPPTMPLLELNLSMAQKAAIQKIHLKLQKDIIPIESKIKELMLDERALVSSPKIEEAKWMELIDQIGKNKILIQQKLAGEQVAIFQVLSEAQQEKYKDLFLGPPGPPMGGGNPPPPPRPLD